MLRKQVTVSFTEKVFLMLCRIFTRKDLGKNLKQNTPTTYTASSTVVKPPGISTITGTREKGIERLPNGLSEEIESHLPQKKLKVKKRKKRLKFSLQTISLNCSDCKYASRTSLDWLASPVTKKGAIVS